MRIGNIVSLVVVVLGLIGCSESSQQSKPVEPAGRLYVLNQTDNTIYVYNTQSLSRVDSLDSKIRKPHYIEFSPDGNSFYITTLTSPGSLARYNAVTGAFVDSTRMPGAVLPSAIAITADGHFGYVSDFTMSASTPQIYKFDLTTLDHVASFQAGYMTHDIKITSDGSVVIACNMASDNLTLVYPDADSVTFVAMNEGLPGDAMACGPYGLAIDHRDSLCFVACMEGMQMRVFDIAARTMVDMIDIPVDTAGKILAGPTLLAVSPDNDVVWITTQSGNSVVAVRLSTRQVIADIPLATQGPFGITMSADGSRVYVACAGKFGESGRVYVIDGNSRTIVTSFPVGKESLGLTWHSQ
ncbi:MAG: YncE family protein [Candidatus Zixiibacteriota bacterium]